MPFDLAFGCVAATSVLAFVPHCIRFHYYYKLSGGKYNNLESRQQYTNNPLLNDPAAAIVKRASNAHQNALENLPFIIGGVLMAKQARLPSARINRLALIHFICRLLYVPLYVWTTRQRYSYIRTLVYTGGLAASLALMVEATLA